MEKQLSFGSVVTTHKMGFSKLYKDDYNNSMKFFFLIPSKFIVASLLRQIQG